MRGHLIKAAIILAVMATGLVGYGLGHQTITESRTAFDESTTSTTSTTAPDTTTTTIPETTTTTTSSNQNDPLASRVDQLEGQVDHLNKTAITEPDVTTTIMQHPVVASPVPHAVVPCNPSGPASDCPASN